MKEKAEDTSNQPIAESLLEAGIPKEDIVLAFHAPDKRQYTDFAAAYREINDTSYN